MTAVYLLGASGCCVSLPKAAPKAITSLAIPSSSDRVVESSAVWRDESRSRDVPVHIYAPADVSGRLPVVIFSHGIGENRDSYAYIGRTLAANGFISVHLTHAGTDKAVLERGYWKLYQATKDPQNWRARPLDVRFALDQLSKRSDVDRSRVAVAGHSAGAFTAFAVAGVRAPTGEGGADPRVRVIVAMSMPKIPGLNYDNFHVPALNITGTCDSSIIYRTRPKDRRVPFEQTHATDQYLVTIKGVNHNVFSNVEDPHHGIVLQLTIAFLRAYLLNDRVALAWFRDAGYGRLGDNAFVLERK